MKGTGKVFLLTIFMFFTVFANWVFAETSISIAPAPIGYPGYLFSTTEPEIPNDDASSDQDDFYDNYDNSENTGKGGRWEVNYISVEGEDLSMTVYGGGFLIDHADSKEVSTGMRVGASFLLGNGDAGETTTISYSGLNFNLGITHGIKAGKLTPIFFALYAYSSSYITLENDIDEDNWSTTNVDITTQGYNLGVQFVFDTGNFLITPSYTQSFMSGTSEVDTYGESGGTWIDMESESDVEFETSSISFDILNKDTGWTLSAAIQAIANASDDDDDGVDTTTLSFGKKF